MASAATTPKSSAGLLLLGLLLFFGLFVPLSAWFGWYDSAAQMQFMARSSPESSVLLTHVFPALLLLIPVLWIVMSRVIDTAALFIIQNALIFFGYFFLEENLVRLDPSVAPGTLKMAPFILLINALGFIVFFTSMLAAYLFAGARNAGRPIAGTPPAQLLPPRMILFIRILGALACAFIALPMLVTHTLPMLAADPAEARFTMLNAGGVRPFYHVGTTLIPVAGGGLVIIISRSLRRCLGIDGILLFSMGCLQMLTSNRLPLSNMLVMALALITLSRPWRRGALVLLICGYLTFFMGLSGFSGMLRTQETKADGENIVAASFRAAFVGDNLIDLRDGSWVFSLWDQKPLLGKTYLGALAAFIPSAVFPEKKAWHLGMNTVRIVGWEGQEHYGIRISFFGEAFLNFGWAGVVALGVVLGSILGTLLRIVHLRRRAGPLSLYDGLRLMILMEIFVSFSNTGDAFIFWSMGAFLLVQRLVMGQGGKGSAIGLDGGDRFSPRPAAPAR